MEFIPLYVGILVIIIFYYAFKKSLKAKNEYYQKILPVAQEKIIKALNVIERKQAQKQAQLEDARKKYLKRYGTDRDLKNQFVEREEYMDNL
jgi:membrane-associated HD superfamily phosphohydrolase